MSKIWFTSDFHLGHQNIIHHCNRPFTSVEEMNEILLENLNSLVHKDDYLYILGDLVWDHRSFVVQYYIQQIRCRKICLGLGNHDKYLAKNMKDPIIREKKDFVNIFHGFLETQIDGVPVTLCHYPMRSWNKSYHGALHLHGHSHGNLPPYKNSLDVGVDNHDFKPIHWEKVIKKIEEQNNTERKA